MSRMFFLAGLIAALSVAIPALASSEPGERGHVHRADAVLPEYRPSDEGSGPSASAASVFGPDERIRVQETTQYPWSAIAFLGLFDDTEEVSGMCTGTFIGPHVLLTAAHCLFSDGVWTSDIVVVPGKNGPLEPFGYQFAETWWIPDEWFETGDSTFDWGLVVLPDDTLGNEVGWLRVANLRTETLLSASFRPAIAGYPSDKQPAATMWFGMKQAFIGVEQFFLRHDIDTFPGASGSAVFSANLESDYLGDVVGIHVLGGPQYNRASRVDAELLAYLFDACEEAGCEFAYYEEAGETPTPTPTATPTPTPTPTPPPPAGGGRPFRGVVPGVSRD